MSKTNQISLSNLFIYNPKYGNKEGHEHEKIFYYYPQSDTIEIQIRIAGFCAGIVKFTETFNPTSPCESVHTEQKRYILQEVDKEFWMVIGLNVPYTETNGTKEYNNDAINDKIYLSVLKQTYNMYKLFNGTLNDYLDQNGIEKLKENLNQFFNTYIEKKLNVKDSDIMNTFNGMQFLSLDRSMFLKIQSLLNILEEQLPIVDKTVIMYRDQVIWSGLDQDDISIIYNYLKELVLNNFNENPTTHAAKFLINNLTQKQFIIDGAPNDQNEIFQLDRVFIDRPLQQYFLIPYNLSKLTFFIFIKANEELKMSILKQIDEILGASMVTFSQEISEQLMKRNMNNTAEKELRYIYFNRLNLAQKSTIHSSGDTPKYILNFIADIAKDLSTCYPSGEIFTKTGNNYWIAAKKSDFREVYVIISQKGTNILAIDEELKQLCSTDFNNIFFME